MSEKYVIAKTTTGKDVNPSVEEFPEKCPLCHHAIDARYITAYLHKHYLWLEIMFQCPREACRHYFIAYYSAGQVSSLVNPETLINYPYELTDVKPSEFHPTEFGKHIISVSS